VKFWEKLAIGAVAGSITLVMLTLVAYLVMVMLGKASAG
jgi:hypothetical protein